MSAEILQQIAKEVAACTKCPLSKGRCKAVPGEGSPNASIIFIGEGPGYHEDQQGRPFVGPSGQLLDQLLAKIQIKREDVFITNVVKCRPPNNRDPEPAELEACKSYLDRQIAAINPRLIITLGRFSMARYWPGKRISEVHGQPKVENGRMFMAMFHPAAALRDRQGPLMQKFKQDGLSIPKLLEKAEELARAELWGLPVPTIEPAPAPVPAPVVSPVVAASEPAEVIENGAIAEKAEKKSSYRARAPKVAEPVETAGEVVAEAPQLNGMLSPNEPSGVAPAEEPTKTVRRPRKPKAADETNASESSGAAMNGEAALSNGTSPTLGANRPAPLSNGTRRKKKEAEGLAEQLTMF